MIVQRDDKRYDLVGVVSWGNGCARRDYPGVIKKNSFIFFGIFLICFFFLPKVYTRVTRYLGEF